MKRAFLSAKAAALFDILKQAFSWLGRPVIAFLLLLSAAAHAGEVRASTAEILNIYSHRQPFLVQPVLEAFTARTGIETRMVYANEGLAERLEMEGPSSPADLILTVDIARLSVYAEKGLLAPVTSPVLEAAIPAHLRSPDKDWFAFSKRARVLAVSKDRVADGAISRIEDLAKPDWQGRICTRKGSHVYNRALLASIIAAHGEAEALQWTRALVGNLARKPQGNDRAQAKAIWQGQCDVAIMNHYYYGVMLRSEEAEQQQWAAAIKLVFPNQADRGHHVNISGGGIAKYSRNKAAAQKLLEFLVSEEAQMLYAKLNYEYPVTPAVPLPAELAQWGKTKEDQLPIARIAALSPVAQRIINQTGW